jgi:PIN domain nuclease of toxin-antitoxin system
MKYLIDTHILIWAIVSPEKLSIKVTLIFNDPENEIFVSSISFWEISLTFSLGKIDLINIAPEDFPHASLQTGFSIMQLSAEDCSTLHHLNLTHHKDPFDRLLIWIAINNNFTFISSDKTIKKYSSERLKVIW